MLSLDQVRLLENRVEKAVGKIASLTDENTRLRSQLSGLQTRVNELEGLVRSFKDDQGRIEEGILSALDRLSAFEDSVFHGESTAAREADSADATELQGATEETVLTETPIESDSIVDDGASSPIAESEQERDPVPQLDIEAKWQAPPAKPSADGQMDIF